jgi:hypothetical protein
VVAGRRACQGGGGVQRGGASLTCLLDVERFGDERKQREQVQCSAESKRREEIDVADLSAYDVVFFKSRSKVWRLTMDFDMIGQEDMLL